MVAAEKGYTKLATMLVAAGADLEASGTVCDHVSQLSFMIFNASTNLHSDFMDPAQMGAHETQSRDCARTGAPRSKRK